ncbi:A0A073K549 (Uncharacterized protein) [Bacillus mycoides]|jgi:hypothetical protein|uniref:Uncharacterized protein n=1 Tax=Bacillus mycoides TaxID=1405 RepID=A0A1C3THE5_BACMY|nr:hypothetical protein [Bacillus mycoides]ARJ25425.1 hypothetical protein B7492_30610 [Bacillus mycoides]KZD40397.1 hypothetical protein B4083_1937 [Bacillus cereus]SCB02532.1 A0A073K549 (Uncharacterized protein) [Bacillus mycoides]
MTEKYKIAEHLVMRENDAALFNASNFQIMKFNSTGFDLLRYIQNNECSFNEYQNYANSQGISEEDFTEFLDKCLEHGIINAL